MAGRVLVVQMAKLGDFIQSTPLLANLRHLYPGARVTLAGEQPAVLEAARLSPLVDEALALPADSGGLAGSFEAVVVLNSHPRAAAVAAGVRAQTWYGPRLAGDRLKFTPAQDFLMGLMSLNRTLGRFNLVDVWASLLPGGGAGPLVWPAGKPARPAGASLKVGFQLGGRNHHRRWPVENFAALARLLAQLGLEFSPTLLGSSEERVLGLKYERLSQPWGGPPPVNLIGRTSLAELGRTLAGLDLLVTADTGVMHLAAAVGRPVLALFFGPAYGPETGPYGPGHLLYQALADCGPCREGAGCGRRQCLELPRPEPAAALAARLLGHTGAEGGPDFDLPPGHRVWRTGRDDFGQNLQPLNRPRLTEAEALALALT
ncbi:MAG: glycosyltransferase family 9 protein, partial [Candidatus Adiutrix sp.]|nr:glycosyltransferase family 9 protein [Candidatus Adiutrix sp.]